MHLPGVGATMDFIALFIVGINIAWWLLIGEDRKWGWTHKPTSFCSSWTRALTGIFNGPRPYKWTLHSLSACVNQGTAITLQNIINICRCSGCFYFGLIGSFSDIEHCCCAHANKGLFFGNSHRINIKLLLLALVQCSLRLMQQTSRHPTSRLSEFCIPPLLPSNSRIVLE